MQCGHNGAQFTPDKEIKYMQEMLWEVAFFFFGRILEFIYLPCMHTVLVYEMGSKNCVADTVCQ